MFTVKLISYFDDGSQSETSISCPHYRIYTRGNGFNAITVFKDFTETDGVEYKVMRPDVSTELAKQMKADNPQFEGFMHHHACYIENSAGKTINHF